MFSFTLLPRAGGRTAERLARLALVAACITLPAQGAMQSAHAQATDKQAAKSDTKKSAPPRKAGKGKNDKNKTMVEARRILVFPADTKGGVSDQLTDIIASVEQGRLAASGSYHSVYFLASLPTIKRALLDQTLSTADIQPPFDNDAKIKRLARIAGFDMALVTSVNDYQYDADKQQVSIVLTLREIDLAGEKPVIRAAGDSESSPEKAAKDEKDTAPALQVARDLTEKLMTELLRPVKAAPTPEKTKTAGAK